MSATTGRPAHGCSVRKATSTGSGTTRRSPSMAFGCRCRQRLSGFVAGPCRLCIRPHPDLRHRRRRLYPGVRRSRRLQWHFVNADQNFTGWTIGAGAEYAFTNNWIGRRRVPRSLTSATRNARGLRRLRRRDQHAHSRCLLQVSDCRRYKKWPWWKCPGHSVAGRPWTTV